MGYGLLFPSGSAHAGTVYTACFFFTVMANSRNTYIKLYIVLKYKKQVFQECCLKECLHQMTQLSFIPTLHFRFKNKVSSLKVKKKSLIKWSYENYENENYTTINIPQLEKDLISLYVNTETHTDLPSM